MIMNGINASPGIAIAKAFVYQKKEINIEEKKSDPTLEKNRFQEALKAAKTQIEAIYTKALAELGEEDAAIFEAHGLLLEDPELTGGIESEIVCSHCCAEWAVKQVIENYTAMFEAMDDPYFAARAADMRDVGERLLNNLTGADCMDLSCLTEDVIIIAEDLVPSDTAQMDKKHVLGFATNLGSRTSHTAIMARTLEIPAILGLGDVTSRVKNSDLIIVDGNNGEIIIAPTEEECQKYQKIQHDYEKQQAELKALKDLPAITLDGCEVEMAGNIGNPEEAEAVILNGGEGVGLYRTEFLFMNCETMPDEEKQFEAYLKVAQRFPEGGVIIRTMDIGGDKKLPYLPMDEEMNPFLGLRAVRLCFAQQEIFKTQLRAICRASAFGKVRIMFPMISGIQELRQAKAMVKETMAELKNEGVAYDPEMAIGVMIEIPSAAMTADILVKEADFFSIGTNDLCQYTLAVDRMNQNVAYLYDPLNPAVLRLIKKVIEASNGKPGCFTGMCGEMAGDPKATLILLGMGLKEFSMSASSIPQIKKIIRSVTMAQAKNIANQALNMESGEDIAEMVWHEMQLLNLNII